MADTNVSETIGKFETEAIPTSGRNVTKMTKRVEVRENNHVYNSCAYRGSGMF